jgi:2-polyprenyl-3-methyl-5-hydroxy-6-metoxy-1,4-benzoquinol methylase
MEKTPSVLSLTYQGKSRRPALRDRISLLIDFLKRRSSEDSSPYYSDVARGLHGRRTIARRRRGLDFIISKAAGSTVLDVGCAEGLVAELFLEAGVAYIQGIDINASRIAAAKRLFATHENARFDVGDITRWRRCQRQAALLPQYDIVLMLAVYPRLPAHSRAATLRRVLALSGRWFVMRCIHEQRDEATEIVLGCGFDRIIPAGAARPSGLRFFERAGAGPGAEENA